jgi:hypothetical protein
MIHHHSCERSVHAVRMITATWRCVCAPPGNSNIALAAAHVSPPTVVVVVAADKVIKVRGQDVDYDTDAREDRQAV